MLTNKCWVNIWLKGRTDGCCSRELHLLWKFEMSFQRSVPLSIFRKQQKIGEHSLWVGMHITCHECTFHRCFYTGALHVKPVLLILPAGWEAVIKLKFLYSLVWIYLGYPAQYCSVENIFPSSWTEGAHHMKILVFVNLSIQCSLSQAHRNRVTEIP